jgi:hypothetical protein
MSKASMSETNQDWHTGLPDTDERLDKIPVHAVRGSLVPTSTESAADRYDRTVREIGAADKEDFFAFLFGVAVFGVVVTSIVYLWTAR